MLERLSWLVLAFVVHLPPFLALFFPQLITRLYSIDEGDPNFALLHHRAALFGVIVLLCLWAAFDPHVRKVAFMATALSMISFLLIYFGYGQPPAFKTIALVDGLGLPCLAYVGWKAFSS